MYAKSVALSALLVAASLSAVSAAPFERRCIGACGSKQTNGQENQSTTNTNNSSTVNTNNTAEGNNNMAQTGNSGGGNSFGNASVGKVCRRAFFEARGINHAQHMDLVARNAPAKPAAKHAAAPHPAAKPPGLNINSNKWTTNKATTTNANSNNRSTNVDNTKSNNANFSNNSGQITGSGVVCRREFLELEIERRELDAGAAVLSALGGQHARSFDDTMTLLATRDLGRMSDALGVSARGHSIDEATHYKRDVGLQCASAQCDDLTRREAEEMLRFHARDLGFAIDV